MATNQPPNREEQGTKALSERHTLFGLLNLPDPTFQAATIDNEARVLVIASHWEQAVHILVMKYKKFSMTTSGSEGNNSE